MLPLTPALSLRERGNFFPVSDDRKICDSIQSKIFDGFMLEKTDRVPVVNRVIPN